jgi:hypothetical protein
MLTEACCSPVPLMRRLLCEGLLLEDALGSKKTRGVTRDQDVNKFNRDALQYEHKQLATLSDGSSIFHPPICVESVECNHRELTRDTIEDLRSSPLFYLQI